MKYINKETVTNNLNSLLFSTKNDNKSITLLKDNSIFYGDYDIYIKIKNTDKFAFICTGPINVTDTNFNQDFELVVDGVKYTYNDICHLYETLDLGLSDYNLQNYEQNYLTGRICFPFETINEEHVIAFKLINTNTEYNFLGGWSGSSIMYGDICVVKHLPIFFTSTFNNYEKNNCIYYFNNLEEDKYAAQTLDDKMAMLNSCIIRDAKYLYLPKNIKRLSPYTCQNLSLSKVNFDELTNLEIVCSNNVFQDQSNDDKVIDLSKHTKLKTIESTSFVGIKNVTKVILPPNLETLGNFTFCSNAYKNATVEIPVSLIRFSNAFTQSTGDLTIKFITSTPPSYNPLSNYGGAASLCDLGHEVFIENRASYTIMIPRGSKKQYLAALIGFDKIYNTEDSLYEYIETEHPEYLEKIIEYDPE